MELREEGFCASCLRSEGFDGMALQDAGFTARELRGIGVSAAQLVGKVECWSPPKKVFREDVAELMDAGFSVAELCSVTWDEDRNRSLGKPIFRLRHFLYAGVDVVSLLHCGFHFQDLLDAVDDAKKLVIASVAAGLYL